MRTSFLPQAKRVQTDSMTLEHRIDLSSIPHLPGRSTDLEAKRRRLWQSLPEEERQGAIEAYARPVAGWELPCIEAGAAYERALYVLAVTGARLTPRQIAYVLLARWHRNTDAGTVRARLAAMVRRGHARWTRDGHFFATEQGVVHLRGVEAAWMAGQRATTGRGLTDQLQNPSPSGRGGALSPRRPERVEGPKGSG